MSNNVEKVLAIAAAEVGYLEKSAEAYEKDHNVLDLKEEGAGSENYTKYGRDTHEISPKIMPFNAAWCDSFVDWCFYKAYGITKAKALLCGDFSPSTKKSAKMFKDMKAWYTKPQPGDQIFFKDGNGNICHTGLVYKVADGNVYTIEGNTSSAEGVVANGGCVRQKKYSLLYKRIAGYGRPDYDASPVSPDAEEEAKKAEWQNLIIELQKALNAEYDANLKVNGVVDDKLILVTPTLNARIRSTRPKTVTAFQNLLSYWGYACLADGDFYSATEKMVKAFQSEKLSPALADGEFTARNNSWRTLLKMQ